MNADLVFLYKIYVACTDKLQYIILSCAVRLIFIASSKRWPDLLNRMMTENFSSQI